MVVHSAFPRETISSMFSGVAVLERMDCFLNPALTSSSIASFNPARDKIVLGTPTNIELFNADSRMIAAWLIASDTLRRVVASPGSFRVAKWYNAPTEEGKLHVNRVHVVSTNQPVSAFLCLASLDVLLKTECREDTVGAFGRFGLLSESRSLTDDGKCLTDMTENTTIHHFNYT